jgi:hypothetical protein
MATSPDHIGVSVVLANLDTNEKCDKSFVQRQEEADSFIEKVAPTTDIFLIQEAYTHYQTIAQLDGSCIRVKTRDDQIGAIENRLQISGNWKHWSIVEYQTDSLTKSNLVITNTRRVKRKERKDESQNDCSHFFPETYQNRICYGRMEIEGESILAVSFHGYHKKIATNKILDLKILLEAFSDYKRSSRCGHFFIGGDFNVDLDRFEREESQFLEKWNLKVVPYKNQRDGRKIDGLICDKEIADLGVAVTVYTDNDTLTEDENTKVCYSGISLHTLDHHPIKFNLKLPIR